MAPKDDADDGWSFVSSKRTRQSGRKGPSLPAVEARAAPPARTTSNLSLKDIISDYKKFSQQWLDSECCKKLKEVVKSKTCSPHPTNAVCLGIGSFDPEDGSWHVRRRSHIQLAAFMTLVKCLETSDTQRIRCIFQEPCFTASDKEFIKWLDFEILDSPQGFEQVSEDSVVFGIHLYRNIYSSAIENAIPAIFIGTGYDVWESYADSNDPAWDRIRRLHNDCDRVSFPNDKDFYPTFTSTTIHWRKPNEESLDELSKTIESLSLNQSNVIEITPDKAP